MRYEEFNYMWFGTRDYMQYIPCPAINGDHSSVGWSTKSQYLNGGAFVRTSRTTHKEYQLSWNLANRDELQPIYDFYDGIYGDGPMFFIDPFAADKNILPKWWAAPSMALDDAPVLIGEDIPATIITPSNQNKYPSRGALYAITASTDRKTLYVPLPPGKAFWIGMHGVYSGTARVTINAFLSDGSSSGLVPLPSMPVDSNDQCNYYAQSVSGTTITGIEISFTGSGSIGMYGLIAKILDADPTTTVPIGPGTPVMPPESGRSSIQRPLGQFVGGMGHSGCSFEEAPTLNAYSSALDLIGSSATLVETEGWV